LRAWDIDTAELRNRAVHAGYDPTLEECRASYDALMGLEQFVCNRLASNAILTKYPRTLTWVRRHWQSRRAVVVEPEDPEAIREVVKSATKVVSIDGFVGSTLVSPTTVTAVAGDWTWDADLIPECEDGPTYEN